LNKQNLKICLKPATPNDWKVIRNIRKIVFGNELHISENEIFDNNDDRLEQFLIVLDDLPIGSLRINHNENFSKIERMAILKEYRNCGYGTTILDQIHEYCISKNIQKIVLDSIYDVRGFYAKCGYLESGFIFNRVGIPHIKMYLDL